MGLEQEIITAIQNAIGRKSSVLHEPSFSGNELKYVLEYLNSESGENNQTFSSRLEKEFCKKSSFEKIGHLGERIEPQKEKDYYPRVQQNWETNPPPIPGLASFYLWSYFFMMQ